MVFLKIQIEEILSNSIKLKLTSTSGKLFVTFFTYFKTAISSQKFLSFLILKLNTYKEDFVFSLKLLTKLIFKPSI